MEHYRVHISLIHVKGQKSWEPHSPAFTAKKSPNSFITCCAKSASFCAFREINHENVAHRGTHRQQ